VFRGAFLVVQTLPGLCNDLVRKELHLLSETPGGGTVPRHLLAEGTLEQTVVQLQAYDLANKRFLIITITSANVAFQAQQADGVVRRRYGARALYVSIRACADVQSDFAQKSRTIGNAHGNDFSLILHCGEVCQKVHFKFTEEHSVVGHLGPELAECSIFGLFIFGMRFHQIVQLDLFCANIVLESCHLDV